MTSNLRPAETNLDRGLKFDARILVIASAGLLLSLPCLVYGFPFYGDDSVSNAIYSTDFARQFWSGDLYPRWLQGVNGGLGSAVTYYYPPVAYWTVSVLKVFFGNDPDCWRKLGVSACLAVMASGAIVYVWLVRTVERRAALIASLVYLILPYHTSIDLYARGALAELWTFVWMPLVLWSVDRLSTRGRFGLVALGGSYALLIMTHLPTTLIFSLVPLGYSLYLAPNGDRRRAFVLTIAGMTLGIGLSAIYLLPALTMQEFAFHTTEGITGHYYYGNWFLFTGIKWSGSWSEYFLAATEVFGLACLAFVLSRFLPDVYLKRNAGFWFIVALCSFFMMTPPSNPIWHVLPTLQKVQFPFRFNTALSLAAVPLTAIAFAFFEGPRKRKIILLVTLLLFAAAWIHATTWRAYFAYPQNYVEQSILDYTNKRFQQRRDTDEFRPRWVVSIEPPELDALFQRIGRSGSDLNRVNMVNGQGTFSVEKWSPREIVMRADSPTGAAINVSQFYFPGWFVRVDETNDSRAVEPSKPGGLIRTVAPPGQHLLTLYLGKRMPELLGQIISAASLGILVLVGIAGGRKRRSRIVD